MRNTLALAVLVLAAGQAAAVNKCVGPDGKVFYQDTLCPTETGKTIQTNQNTFERTDADRRNTVGAANEQERKKQQAAEKKALDDQTAHAKMIQRKAQADERAQATKNSKTRSTIPSGSSATPSRVVTCCK